MEIAQPIEQSDVIIIIWGLLQKCARIGFLQRDYLFFMIYLSLFRLAGSCTHVGRRAGEIVGDQFQISAFGLLFAS